MNAITPSQSRSPVTPPKLDNEPLQAGYGVTVTYADPAQSGQGANLSHQGRPPIRLSWDKSGNFQVEDLTNRGAPVSRERAKECLQALKNLRDDCIKGGKLVHAPGSKVSPPTEAEFRRWNQFLTTLNRLEMLINASGNTPTTADQRDLIVTQPSMALNKATMDANTVSFNVA